MAKSEMRYIQYYTAGSAARQLAPLRTEEAKPAPRPRRRKRPVLYIDPVAIMGMVTAIILVVCMAIGFGACQQARQERMQMENYANSLEAENAQLAKTYAEGYDLDQIRLDAVLMGYVPESQVPHITIDSPAPVQQEEQPGFMESIWIYLTELFA